MDALELEGVAKSVLEKHDLDGGPVDAIDLANAVKVEIRWLASGRGYRFGRRVYIPLNTRISRLHGVLAHEIAHVLLDDHRIEQSEPAAGYLGAALLVYRRILDRQLRGGWDLRALQAYHVNASAELIARRITEVRAAMAAVYDHGRFRYRVGVGPELDDEAQLVDDVLATDAPVRLNPRCGAWPVIDGSWRRVIVIAGP